jgi:hypothetical protein
VWVWRDEAHHVRIEGPLMPPLMNLPDPLSPLSGCTARIGLAEGEGIRAARTRWDRAERRQRQMCQTRSRSNIAQQWPPMAVAANHGQSHTIPRQARTPETRIPRARMQGALTHPHSHPRQRRW